MQNSNQKEKGLTKAPETEALEDFILMQLCPLQSLISVASGASDEDAVRLLGAAESVFYSMKNKIENALAAVRKVHGLIELEITSVNPADKQIVGVKFKAAS